MFDHVVLRRAEGGTPITAGQIAEALLFYQKVHLVVDRGTLLDLVRQIGTSGLLALIARPDFSAVYTEELLAVMTNSVGVSKYHDFIAATVSGSPAGRPLETPTERVQHDLQTSGIEASEARRFAIAFLKRVPLRKMSGNFLIKGGIVEAARSDLNDEAYLSAALAELVTHVPGGFNPGPTLKAEVLKGEQGFFVFDNIDFARLNARRAAMDPPLDPLTTAYFLSQLQDARADLALAAHYGGDFITSTVTSAVIRLKYDMLLARTKTNSEEKRHFVELVLPDMPTVAEQVDSGARSFKDFLVFLDKSAKFREWLKTTNPDEGLTREYLRAISSQDWIQSSRSKGVRYLLTLAVDSTNPVAGVVAGFVDNFLIEKLLSGWRPNHFVNDRLVPFVSGSTQKK